jgi:hypothetical protein
MARRSTGIGNDLDIKRVAERLRGMRQERDREAGSEWAKDWATLEELQEIADLRSEAWSSVRFDHEHSAHEFFANRGERPCLDANDEGSLAFINGAGAVYDAVTPYLAEE